MRHEYWWASYFTTVAMHGPLSKVISLINSVCRRSLLNETTILVAEL